MDKEIRNLSKKCLYHFISVCRKFGAKILRLRRTSAASLRMTVSIVNRTSQSLPLFNGRWHGVAVTEGIYGFPSRIGLQCNDKLEPRNPSVKNQRFLPAPFTQGSLGRCRDCASLTLYTREPLASPFGRGARRAERALSVSDADSSPKGGAKGCGSLGKRSLYCLKPIA